MFFDLRCFKMNGIIKLDFRLVSKGRISLNSPVIKYIKDRREEIRSRWMEEMDNKSPLETNNYVTGNDLDVANNAFYDIIYSYISEEADNYDVEGFIGQILQYGWPLSYLTTGLQTFRRCVMTIIGETEEGASGLLELYKKTDEIIDPIFNELVKDATDTWEHTMRMQKNALLELSAPLIPIMDKISVMPLIGTIDTERARLIMENLLQGVIMHRSEVVLIDITGVPIVDTMVAHHIIQASEAVRLVGSECILVGIRPEIAQTIVNLGIELNQFPTRSTLRKGIETALEKTKRKIVDIELEG